MRDYGVVQKPQFYICINSKYIILNVSREDKMEHYSNEQSTAGSSALARREGIQQLYCFTMSSERTVKC